MSDKAFILPPVQCVDTLYSVVWDISVCVIVTCDKAVVYELTIPDRLVLGELNCCDYVASSPLTLWTVFTY